MKETIYPCIEEALYLHDLLLREFGGAAGILDKGLLDSALARPRSGYYQSLSEQAAALLQSLALNHAFVDGNKRVAFALSAVFLKLNGFNLEVSLAHGKSFMEQDVVSNHADLATIRAWLETRMIVIT